MMYKRNLATMMATGQADQTQQADAGALADASAMPPMASSMKVRPILEDSDDSENVGPQAAPNARSIQLASEQLNKRARTGPALADTPLPKPSPAGLDATPGEAADEGDEEDGEGEDEYSPSSPQSVDDLVGAGCISPKTGRWTKHEDELLRQAVTEYGPKNWKRISDAAFDGLRTDVQCLHRWQKVLKPGLKKGQWTEEEDKIVREEVARMGGAANVKWSAVAMHLPGRLGKQVRERWQNHLDPCLTKEPWAEEEDQLLISLQAVMGNRWSEIARAFTGRSENSVKNRWNSKQRKNLAMERKLRTGSELGLRSSAPQPGVEQDGDTQIRINFQKALQAAKTEELAAAGITSDSASGMGLGLGMGMGGDPHSGLTCDTSMGAGDASAISAGGSAAVSPGGMMHPGMSADAGAGAGVLGAYNTGCFQGMGDLSMLHNMPGARMPPVSMKYSDQTESPRFGSPSKARGANRPRSPHAITKPPTVDDIKGMEDAANIIKLLGTNAM